MGPRPCLTPSGLLGSGVARVESERLNDREPGRRTRAASFLRAPVPKLLELGSGVRVGVAAVPSRVAAPSGTSGAGSREMNLIREE